MGPNWVIHVRPIWAPPAQRGLKWVCTQDPAVDAQMAVADLENFTWGGKGVARDLGRVAGEDGTWKPSYIN